MLETQDARNVAFYERLGFAVVDEDTCPIGGYHTWSMLREACGGGVGFRNQGNDPNQNPTFPPGTATGPFRGHVFAGVVARDPQQLLVLSK